MTEREAIEIANSHHERVDEWIYLGTIRGTYYFSSILGLGLVEPDGRFVEYDPLD